MNNLSLDFSYTKPRYTEGCNNKDFSFSVVPGEKGILESIGPSRTQRDLFIRTRDTEPSPSSECLFG